MDTPQPPAWVSKRNGRLVPFEPDRISRSLFAATESLGKPDAFLARELADGVVHFLASEAEDTPPTTEHIEETVIKVVRELGHPALAQAYAASASNGHAAPDIPLVPDGDRSRHPGVAGQLVLHFGKDTPLADVLLECRRGYALHAIFTRDLVAAHADGLLKLTRLEQPDVLAGCVLGLPLRAGIALGAGIQEVSRLAGQFVAVDSPEYFLAEHGAKGVEQWGRELRQGLRQSQLEAVVNLNSAVAPPWAGELADGPLFAAQRHNAHPDQRTLVAELLAEALLNDGRIRVDWHLGARDFAPASRERLRRFARRALEGAALGFVFDRPRRPIPLAEAMDRQHPALLLGIGLNLPRLAEQPGAAQPEPFLRKLGSLGRLALSAAVQKRQYLRRLDRDRPAAGPDDPAVTSAFLLDRARLLAVPIGLETVVRRFVGNGLCASDEALTIGCQIIGRLREALAQDGQSVHLQTCVDGPWAFAVEQSSGWPEDIDAAGLTAWDATAPTHAQLRAASGLHAISQTGTVALFVPEGTAPDKVIESLRMAWQQTEVVRIRLIQGRPGYRQLCFGKGA